VDTLAALRVFVKVVELGSFARAAERLERSTSAVSRQIADLEAHLGARLLQRTTRRLSLTDAGQAFFERAAQVVTDLDEAEASVRSTAAELRGRLRITSGVTFGVRYLAPALAQFARRHPGIDLDLDLSDRRVDLVEEGFDLGIRIGPVLHQGLIARRLGSSRMVCCAAPDYLAAAPQPLAHPADLARHRCLSYTQLALPSTWRFRDAAGEPVEVRVPLGHRANNGRMLVALAAAGLGVAFEPDFIVAPEIQSGRLIKVLSQFKPEEAAISAVYPSRRHLSAKVRQLVDDLAAQFARAAPWRID
jgi:DNA-binding transcriptional LysR family regulator